MAGTLLATQGPESLVLIHFQLHRPQTHPCLQTIIWNILPRHSILTSLCPLHHLISTYITRTRMSCTILRSRAMVPPTLFLRTVLARGLVLLRVPPPHVPIPIWKRFLDQKAMPTAVLGLGCHVAVVEYANRTRCKSSVFNLGSEPEHLHYNLTDNSSII